MQQVCGQSLFPRDYLCAAFKHYTGWCLLSFMWLVSTHEKSMDLLLTLYISKCKTFLFVLQRALICVSCIILFCDRSINRFLGWLGLCIIIFTITFGNWKLRASCFVPKWCNQNLFQIQMYIKKCILILYFTFPSHFYNLKKSILVKHTV